MPGDYLINQFCMAVIGPTVRVIAFKFAIRCRTSSICGNQRHSRVSLRRIERLHPHDLHVRINIPTKSPEELCPSDDSDVRAGNSWVLHSPDQKVDHRNPFSTRHFVQQFSIRDDLSVTLKNGSAPIRASLGNCRKQPSDCKLISYWLWINGDRHALKV
jgi:hypothetical protein